MSEHAGNDAQSNADRPDRRGLLKCMAWAGTGVVWTVAGGVPASALPAPGQAAAQPSRDFTFVQISDSHLGFKKPAMTPVSSRSTD